MIYTPATDCFPTRSARWVADQCRAGRVPGAVKIGHAWFIPDGAAEGPTVAPKPPTVEEAAEHLRRLGVIK